MGKLPDDFYLRINALDRLDKINIRSRPQLTTLNGHAAELIIGETRYFKLVSQTPFYEQPDQGYTPRTTNERFEKIEINTTLRMTPWVSSSGEITVEINPEFRSINDEQQVAELPPNIRTRALKATVRVRDGETIVLGGLIEEQNFSTSTQVPLLGKIPLIGRLFRNQHSGTSTSELLIYVTPRLSGFRQEG